jgi:hypothetical protein
VFHTTTQNTWNRSGENKPRAWHFWRPRPNVTKFFA